MQKEELDPNGVFLIHDFFSTDECDAFIQLTEDMGYVDAPISSSSGFVMRKDIRNNDRVIIDDFPLAEKLWERAREWIQPRFLHWEAIGLNERFRYYRYDVGQRFAIHTDGCFERENGERSHLTFMIYLNDGFEGGETKFYLFGVDMLKVRPKRGAALVFRHSLRHEGAPVENGRKYVMRSDVMYRIAPR